MSGDRIFVVFLLHSCLQQLFCASFALAVVDAHQRLKRLRACFVYRFSTDFFFRHLDADHAGYQAAIFDELLPEALYDRIAELVRVYLRSFCRVSGAAPVMASLRSRTNSPSTFAALAKVL